MGLACGGDPSNPEIALRFFSALRYLERTTVIIHHLPKEGREPFGSAYIRNSARSGWLFARNASPDETAAVVALQHRWTNTGRMEHPIGLTFAFDEDAYTTSVTRTDGSAEQVLRLTGDLGKKAAILAFLEESPGSQLQDIAIAIGEENSKVSVHLSQLKKQGKVNNQLRKWALASPRE